MRERKEGNGKGIGGGERALMCGLRRIDGLGYVLGILKVDRGETDIK